MKFNFYGQSCFSIETADQKILFDPFITENPKAKHLKLSNIEADYILISHGHFDHILDAAALYKLTGATCVSCFEIIQWLAKQGVEKGHPMNLGGKWKFDFGTVKMVNAVHSSSFPDGSYAGPAAGFVVSTPEKTFYYAGDTALHQEMRRYGQEYNFDFVVLPIGDNFTMGINDAVTAATWLNCKTVVGVHFDTYPYIEIDHDDATAAFEAKGIKLILPDIGGNFDL